MKDHREIQVTAAVCVRDGRLLVACRPSGGRHPGAWELPGGKVEPGETPEQCLAREMEEEMGVTVEVGEKIAEVAYRYPDLAIRLEAYRCSITGGEPGDIGCQAHAWLTPEEALELDLLPPDVELLRLVAGRLHQ